MQGKDNENIGTQFADINARTPPKTDQGSPQKGNKDLSFKDESRYSLGKEWQEGGVVSHYEPV